ncbi:GT4 family glycosyltransferase PelF [Desulfurobacterium atlanticum]|uniref:Glycosyltransferase involved in cell wall bisynthesis n=1 Tax=Desulfurobacterium atlanticum TaxID=240169 RepID=A0A238XV48_9BACT|nr:GT4 family glycosyltransferase PelF [Desulfurobacterium atlanticum]SNR62612.1 Glycosyltransferase involved in cell wall bisynthesis [Desulfurobacterium atlanticum]
MIKVNKGKPVDVAIIAEGTYPYVKGGVSSWIHSLISGLEEFNFGVVFLGSREEDYGEIKYKLPENLTYLSVNFIFSDKEKPPPKIIRAGKEKFERIKEIHRWFRGEKGKLFLEILQKRSFYLTEIREEEFLYSKEAWDFIAESYFEYAVDSPFVDYFWTVRNIHDPIWRVSKIMKDIPDTSIVHSPSTGYAGFLSSLLKEERKTPFILTEHGIYTKERKIDIVNADWIKDRSFFFQKEVDDIDYLKKMWINFFAGIGKFSYDASDLIISLFEDARKLQIKLGAPPEKTRVIPNGVKVENFLKSRRKRAKKIPRVIGLIGRVVPIKDIKTFIKAIRIVVNHFPETEGWIIGPTEEDPIYFEECKKLTKVLELRNNIKFLGFQNLKEIFPQIGLTTLTSISEGMPLVVLESFAAGVPAVTTDVGSCRQLIYGGLNEEDIKIGKAGEVCQVANPSQLAKAYIKLLTDEREWKKCQRAGIERVERFYTYEQFIDNYRLIYRSFKNGGNLI